MLLFSELWPSLPDAELGKLFGRHGTDVWHGRKKAQDRYDVDRGFRERVGVLRVILRQQINRC